MDTGKIGRLLSFASRGEVESVKMLLDEGLPPDSKDYDGRTAMHLAASEGHYDVIELLLKYNADVNPVDRWRKTPLADAKRYEARNEKTDEGGRYTKVCKILVDHNGSMSSPFEIDLDEHQLTSADTITSESTIGAIKLANWRGTKVEARIIQRKRAPGANLVKSSDSQLIKQLSLLQRLRHPNIVQFLGAVANFQNKSKPLVLVTEYLPNGDLNTLLRSNNGRIQPKDAVKYALDIARGMNYLHQHRPQGIVHSELNPMNLRRDAAGHLKVGGLGLSDLIESICEGTDVTKAKTIIQYPKVPLATLNYLARYRAPELEDSEKPIQKSVDVYSFGTILREMFEGPCLKGIQAQDVGAHGPVQRYRVRTSPGSKLARLMKYCCAPNPQDRPPFDKIILTLDEINVSLKKKPWWAPIPMNTFVSTLKCSFTIKWSSCIVIPRKMLRTSIASVEDSLRGAPSRSRRGATETGPIRSRRGGATTVATIKEDEDGDSKKLVRSS